jgi:hypothetical protein
MGRISFQHYHDEKEERSIRNQEKQHYLPEIAVD